MSQARKSFLVTSHGRTATYWLASALHLHEDVQCSHGPALPPVLEFSTQPPDEFALQAHQCQDEFSKKSLDAFFAELELASEKPIVGNVHAYAAHQLTTRPILFNPQREIAVINVVRHPLTRIESLARRVLHEARFSDYSRSLLHEHFGSYVPKMVTDYLGENHAVDLEIMENRAFLYAAFSVPHVDSMDFDTPIQHIPMERLTKDAEFFSWFFAFVTQGSANLSGDYLDKVMKSERMNHQAPERPAVALYEKWPTWKKATIQAISEWYGFTDSYSGLGYDFTFITEEGIPQDCMIGGSLGMPIFIGSHAHYNLLKIPGKVLAISQGIGPIDIPLVPAEQVSELLGNGLWIAADTIEEACRQIDRLRT